LIKAFNDEYHASNNTVLQYLNDYNKEHFIGMRSPEAYQDYEIWAEENGLNVQSKKLFTQSMYDVFNLVLEPKKIGGKTARVVQKAKN
jgi:putative DNA primase/helicase